VYCEAHDQWFDLLCDRRCDPHRHHDHSGGILLIALGYDDRN
jgi:hypothetical protein